MSEAAVAEPTAEPEVKPEEKPEEKPGEKPAEATQEDYTLSLPKDALLEAESVERIASWAKERGLSKEDAQAVLERENASLVDFRKSSLKYAENLRESWTAETKADKEVGGAKLEETIKIAKLAIDKFGDPELVKLLDSTGLGNNLGVVKLFYKIGLSLKNEALVMGQTQSAEKRSIENILYDTKE